MRYQRLLLRTIITLISTSLGIIILAGCQLNTPKESLANSLARLCWIAYSPTHFDPTTNPVQWSAEDDVREDLRVLHDAGFNGLVTYSSNYMLKDAPDQVFNMPRLL